MSVYVDKAIYPLGRMMMCHMVADSLDELHAMADTIGVDRRHYQTKPKTAHPHYDICKSKRAMAIKNGAIETDGRTIVKKSKQLKQEEQADD